MKRSITPYYIIGLLLLGSASLSAIKVSKEQVASRPEIPEKVQPAGDKPGQHKPDTTPPAMLRLAQQENNK